jgi:hypothetical protein
MTCAGPLVRDASEVASRTHSMAVFRCSACQAGYDETTWQRLALVERIAPDDVRRYASHWPEGVCVEVRRCSVCGQSIATKRRHAT